ncbi:stage II sporulation protein M [Candidatus Woesearchaeota archaeon]|nr:stage II sporulation protein M [Candidatus Woesearchaeota archaeon]
MVLESLNIAILQKRPFLALLIGFTYTLVGFGVGIIFFPWQVSLAMLFLTTLLLVPSLMKILSVEEKRESMDGLYHFFKDHRDVAEIYISLFIGIFFAYVVLGLLFVPSEVRFNTVFHYQIQFLEKQEGLSGALITGFLEKPPEYTIQQFLGLWEYNLTVGLIFFVLSLAYGAGSIFLAVLNASIFASFMVYVIDFLAKKTAHVYTILGIFMIHLIPEVMGFLLTTIAGGVISKALIREKWGSAAFQNVLRDSVTLLCIAVIFLFVAAWLEVYVTRSLFYGMF